MWSNLVSFAGIVVHLLRVPTMSVNATPPARSRLHDVQHDFRRPITAAERAKLQAAMQRFVDRELLGLEPV